MTTTEISKLQQACDLMFSKATELDMLTAQEKRQLSYMVRKIERNLLKLKTV